MNWIEIEIKVPAGEMEEIITQLEAEGFSGFVIEDEAEFLRFLEENRSHWDYVDKELQASMKGKSLLRFYLENTEDARLQLQALKDKFSYHITDRMIAEEDWANNWKRYYKPIEVGTKFLVIPQWETVDPGEKIPLFLDPGLSFGTGSHPSTQSCLCLLESLPHVPSQVLDLGTGSGILAIAALKLGATHVVACDIDPQAEKALAINMQCNQLSPNELSFYSGNVLEDKNLQSILAQNQYGLIFANIVADVIVPLAGHIPPLLAPNGHFICAGVIDGREQEVRLALEKAGLSVLTCRKQEDWYSFLCKL